MAIRLGQVVLLTLSVCVSLVVAEVGLRSLGLISAGGVHSVDAGEFARLPGMLSPRRTVVDRSVAALPHVVSINALGFRGSPLERTRPAGETRILFLGDSFTYGSYVDDSVTVPQLLESELGRSCRALRVINAGLGGTTIDAHRAILERTIVLDPALVIMMFAENDVDDLLHPLWPELERNRTAKSRFPLNFVYRRTRDLALWNLALRVRAMLQPRAQAAPTATASGGADAGRAINALRARYIQEFRALRDSVARHARVFVVTAMPSHKSVFETGRDEQLAWFHGVAEDAAVHTIDLLGPMRAAGGTAESLYLMPLDGHTSGEGNRVVARALANDLRGHPALAGACGQR